MRPSILASPPAARAAQVIALALLASSCTRDRTATATPAPSPARLAEPLGDEPLGDERAPSPTGTVSINGGAASTNSLEVTLELQPSSEHPVDAFCARAESGPPPPADDGCWRPLAEPRARLAPGDGHQSLFVWWRDVLGAVSATPTVAGILVDRTPPTPPSFLTVAAGHRSVRASWRPSDDASSGVAGYEVATRELPLAADAPRTSGAAEAPRAPSPWSSRDGFTFGAPVAGTSISVELPNGHAFELVVRARDRSGNASAPSEPVRASPRWPWTSEHRTPAGSTLHDVRAVALGSGRRVVVAGAFGQLAFADGALPPRAWRQVDPMTDGHLLSLTRFEAGPTWLVATGEQGLIATSADLGLRWERRAVSDSARFLTVTAATALVAPLDDGTPSGLAPTPTATVLATTDSGEVLRATLSLGRWSPFTSGPERAALWSLRAVDVCRSAAGTCRAPVAIAVGDGPTAIRSTDLGLTWSAARLPGGYAIPERLTSVAAALDGSAVYAGVGETSPFRSGLLVSSDGGETWHEARGEHFLGVSVQALRFRPRTRELWLLGRKDGLQALYRLDTATGDVARFPSPSGVDRPLLAVEPLDAHGGDQGVVAVGQGGELVTSAQPDARPFERLNGAADGPLFDVAGLPDGDGERLWVVGSGGYVARRTPPTDTAATRWEQAAAGLTPHALHSVAVVSTGRGDPAFGMAVGERGVILELDGDAWRLHPDTGIVSESLQSVACRGQGGDPSAVRCYAVGRSGTILQYDGAPRGDWLVRATGSSSAYLAVDTWQDATGLPRAVLVGAQGVYRTQRGGGNFGPEQRVEGLPTSLRGARSSWRGDGRVLAVGSNAAVLLSVDHGERWTNVSPVGFPGVTFFDAASVNDGTGDEWLIVGAFGIVLKGRPAEAGAPSYAWTRLALLSDADVLAISSARRDTRRAWYTTAIGQVLATTSGGE